MNYFRTRLAVRLSFRGACLKLMMFFIPLCALALYNLQLLDDNNHTGIKEVGVDFWFCINYLLWLIVLTALYPSKVNRPTDVFLILYIPICCLCGSVYWKITGILYGLDSVLLLIFLIFPVVFLKIIRKFQLFKTNLYVIELPKFFAEKNLPRVLLVILFVAMVIGINTNGSIGGFDLLESYDRRLMARETFSDGVFARYLYSNAMSGVLAFLAFFAGKQKSIFYFAAAIFFAFFDFWLVGTKAGFLYVLFMAFLGCLLAYGKFHNISFYFLFIIFLLFVASLLEYLAVGRSLLADYIIRRAFMVGVQVQTYYFDAIFKSQDYLDILLAGLQEESASPSFFIGNLYFENPETNANTNAFFYAVLMAGLPGLLICVAFVCLFFYMLDKIYVKTRCWNAIAITALYALFILEQAFTTAFISSGILLCFLLTQFVKNSACSKISVTR